MLMMSPRVRTVCAAQTCRRRPEILEKTVMNPIFLVLASGALALSGNTIACTGKQQNARQIEKAVSGNTICANDHGELWQEQHRGGGQLWDYKKGPADKSDPSSRVGSWSIDQTPGDAKVVYNYGSTSYAWQLFRDDGGSYRLCGPNGGGRSILITIQPGLGGC